MSSFRFTISLVFDQLSANSRRLKDFYTLPIADQKLLDELGWRKKIDLVDEKIEANARFLKSIVDYPQIFEGDDEEDEEEGEDEDDGRNEHSRGHSDQTKDSDEDAARGTHLSKSYLPIQHIIGFKCLRTRMIPCVKRKRIRMTE